MEVLHIAGGGLAGAEAAWQAARLGVPVRLYEMRPDQQTPAHHTGDLAELVCSNSLRSDSLENAVGVLKEEMRRLDSLVLKAADLHRVPAGGALAVDRHLFSREITGALEAHPGIEILREEVTAVPPRGLWIIATGPLTSPALAASLAAEAGGENLYFYDAAAPIVDGETVDLQRAFWASRYGKGEADYLNCPLTEAEYRAFHEALAAGETRKPREFEDEALFEGCLPVESLARRGYRTLLHGPMKPVGLLDPPTGAMPFAVVQLRKEDREGRLLNLVGFQTSLTWPEQKRIFSLVPALKEAVFLRYGVMHRNTFVNSPLLLHATYQRRGREDLFLAGQLTGVEGYVESAGSGLVAGLNAARRAAGLKPLVFPAETVLGALAGYIAGAPAGGFQPMKANFSLLPPLAQRVKNRRRRHQELAERSLAALEKFREDLLNFA
jgi:methylenetetrahydrofolate--tRNA-(uracil-5-)-methyltransferase